MLPDFSTSHYIPGTAILQTLQLLRLQAEQALQILVIWFAVRWQNKGVWSLRNALCREYIICEGEGKVMSCHAGISAFVPTIIVLN